VIDGKWFLIIAADSKSSYIDVSGSAPATVCKIEPTKRGLLLLAGYRQEFQHYSVPTVVEREFDSKGTFSERVRRVTVAMRKALSRQMLRLKAQDPKGYADVMSQGNGGAVTVAVVEKDSIAIRGVKFDSATKMARVILRKDCPGKDCPNGNFLYLLGQVGAMEKYLADHPIPNIRAPHQLVDIARSVIEAAVSARPKDVGPPIEILQIDASGRSWISNTLPCPDH
jgi:hypothetical protein